VLFEPGDVWIVDGRRASHQVMFGRRVVSTLFVAGPEGQPDTSKSFGNSVATLHRMKAEGKDLPRPQVPGEASRRALKKLDLRTAWEDLPDHVRQETLVRF
jgi:hypothetical protein